MKYGNGNGKANLRSRIPLNLKMHAEREHGQDRVDYLPRRERSEVRRDRNDVIFGKVRNHFLHRRHGSAGARSILNTDELPRDIDRLQSSEPGHFAEAP